jgi:hypothetical protein
MTTMLARGLFVVAVAIALTAHPAFGCDLAGPNTHIGTITAIELARPSLTILDIQMNRDVTFQATRQQLEGLSAGQQVAVTYSEANGRLRAERIEPR